MHSFLSKLKKASVGLMVVVLTCGLVYTPASPVLAPKTAEATGVQIVFESGLALIKGTISAVANVGTQISTWYLQWKEMIGDGIAWHLIDMVVQQMIRDTTAWVNSGFQGKPAFVQNLDKFLGNIADNVVGDYIWNSDTLNFMCSPFKLDVKMALDIQYRGSTGVNGVDGIRSGRRAQCTLTGSIANIKGGFDNFINQSWENWFQVAVNQTNNPYGALIVAMQGLEATTSNRISTEKTLLSFGNGFLSQKDANGNIITPGNVIQTQLNNSLNVPRERLAVADEINELISALLNQLLRGVLSNVGGGLAGLGGGDSGTDGIFNDPRYASSSDSALSDQFEKARTAELTYLTNATNGKKTIDAALAKNACDQTLRSQLVAKGAELDTEIAKAQSNLKAIDALDVQSKNGSADAQQAALAQFMQTLLPQLHTDIQLTTLTDSFTLPATTDPQQLESYAQSGNVAALIQLYQNSCTP